MSGLKSLTTCASILLITLSAAKSSAAEPLPSTSIPTQTPGPQPVAVRSAALQALFKDIWEDDLKRSPEFASSIGDRRYNDQLSDRSPKACPPSTLPVSPSRSACPQSSYRENL